MILESRNLEWSGKNNGITFNFAAIISTLHFFCSFKDTNFYEERAKIKTKYREIS